MKKFRNIINEFISGIIEKIRDNYSIIALTLVSVAYIFLYFFSKFIIGVLSLLFAVPIIVFVGLFLLFGLLLFVIGL